MDHAGQAPRAAPPHVSAVLLFLGVCPHSSVSPHLTAETSVIAPGMKKVCVYCRNRATQQMFLLSVYRNIG